MGYYIGLDMGTSSVGWAVTDEKYSLLRRKGKDMWGVRLFDEADTAEKRRAFRIARRRLQREKARIGYLKEIFGPEINKVDPGFLARLNDSFFHQEDKHEHQPFALFADTKYTDKDYYKQFPTIFHLRKELVENPVPHDVRLVYLAVLNLFKHRGHFLFPNLPEGKIGEFSDHLNNLCEMVERCLEIEFPLQKIDGDYIYISEAKVAAYEKHHSDLKKLKEAYYFLGKYDEMFRKMEENTYSAYVGSVNSGKQKQRRGVKESGFFKKIKKDFKKYFETPECKEDEGLMGPFRTILDEIEKGTFLPLHRTRDNGVIPNQINKTELRKILENAEEYLPFLKGKDPVSGLSATERLLELFSFRIPYYVGPLKGVEGSPCWAVRKENGRVLPWNIENKIDVATTAQKFIENLVGHCSWLNNEQVLPKSSLLYEKFMLLNELNNLTIHGEKITPELKQNIFRDLFRKKGKKVTNKMLVDYLKQNESLGPDEGDEALGGYDKETGGFTNTLANQHIFMEVFKTDVLTDTQVSIAEKCIFYSTVYGESKKFMENKLREICADSLSEGHITEDQLQRIIGIKFRNWGNLSKEFLLLQGADKRTGEVLPLITRMWQENKNLMQLMDQHDYTYRDAVLERTVRPEKALSEICCDDLEGNYLSAPVKRMVWQTIRIVQEIVKIMEEEPVRIFIEVTRSEEKNKHRKDSRKKRLEALYKNIKNKDPDTASISMALEGTDESDLRNKKLYLYYMQQGKCLYSGEPIELEHLADKNLYDIDHIYPRSLVKDDSLENNLVLVKAELNRAKTNKFPIEENVRRKCEGLWKDLKEDKFITTEKYERLTRTRPFSQEELAGFVNRQLVETGQGTKAVAGLLTQVFGGRANDRVIYVKGGNVSEFRQSFDLIKCRDVNDFHHAQDAYLNIVVGNVWFTKFTRDARNFFSRPNSGKEGTADTFNLKNLFRERVERGDTVAWEPDTAISTVKKVLSRNTPVITRLTFEKHGGLYDQLIVGTHKIKSDAYLPIKSRDERLHSFEKYGGFGNVATAYFFLVEHKIKKEYVRTLECMPVYLAQKYANKGKKELKEKLEEYCREKLNLKVPSVRLEKIRLNSLLKINGFFVYLTGRSNDKLSFNIATQLILDKEYYHYIKKVVNAVEKKYDDDWLEKEQARITRARVSGVKEIAVTKDMNINLYNLLTKKYEYGIFAKKQNSIFKPLKNGCEKFKKLGLSNQCVVLNNILRNIRLNMPTNLEKIGGNKNAGSGLYNKRITNFKECKLILQSVTGLYEKQLDLLKI